MTGADAVVSRWRSPDEAALYLGVTRRTVDRYRELGLLRAYKLGPRLVRFKTSDLDALMQPEGATP